MRLLAFFIAACLLASSKCEETKLRGHLEPFGKQGPSSGIDEVEGFLSPEDFFQKYVKVNKPLLFKGAAKLSPAFTKWTDQYLREKTPPRPVGDVFIEHSKKENRSQAYNFVHFSKFLDIYNTSNIYMVSDVPSFLLEDLVLPFPLQCSNLQNGGLDTHVAWFSSGGTSSVIHHDSYENINCLYRGRKSIVFVNSRKFKKATNSMIDKGDGAFSSADVDKINVKERPEFGEVEYQIASMEAGDCLYIPFLWIHQIRSFDPNLAVNVWWPKRSKLNLKNCKTEYDTSITFNKVLFKSIHEQILQDAESVRQTAAFYMKLKSYETFDQFLELLSEGNSKSRGDPQFAAAAKDLFDAIDLNKDGKINQLDVAKKMNRIQYQAIKEKSNLYNMAVFRIREQNDSAVGDEKLPKFFKTSISDRSVFSNDKTWPLPPGSDDEGDADDEPDDEQNAESDLNKDEQSNESSDPNKDEQSNESSDPNKDEQSNESNKDEL